MYLFKAHDKIKFINQSKLALDIGVTIGYLNRILNSKIKCSKIPELSSNWKKLPLSSEIDKALSMKFCDGNGCKDTYEKYLIPKLESGYYYFFDRHDLANDINDDSELNNRSSWNFSVAIYDFGENIIYYYELDT